MLKEVAAIIWIGELQFKTAERMWISFKERIHSAADKIMPWRQVSRRGR
jgi:hypothetical protein